jgi:octaprenyl-diphosphate synthase
MQPRVENASLNSKRAVPARKKEAHPSLRAVMKPVEKQLALVRQRVLDAVPTGGKLAKVSPSASHLLGKHGKYLRPALVLLTCGLCGEEPDQAVEYASVMELVHVCSLVFDDLLDGSELRRGRKTINALYGEQTAFLTGTHILLEASNRMAFEGEPARKVLMRTLNSMFQGEVLQFQSREKFNLSEETYMEIIADKSASAMSACCSMGALAADHAERERDMGSFGLELGVAFQIRDDVLDLVADAGKLGKELGSDLRDARMTLPLIHCVRNTSRSNRRFIKSVFGLNSGRKIDVEKVEEIVEKAGSIAYCMERAHSLKNKAIARLEDFDDSRYKDSLAALCRFAVERDY